VENPPYVDDVFHQTRLIGGPRNAVKYQRVNIRFEMASYYLSVNAAVPELDG
jgi:hypothetical protein